MEETTEAKLNKEINTPAIDILKAVGFTYEFTDLDELCRKLKLVTFADFRAVTSDMISGAGLITKILERKLAQLCEQCANVEAYKRWRRRTLMFLAAPTDPPPLPAPPHQPGSKDKQERGMGIRDLGRDIAVVTEFAETWLRRTALFKGEKEADVYERSEAYCGLFSCSTSHYVEE